MHLGQDQNPKYDNLLVEIQPFTPAQIRAAMGLTLISIDAVSRITEFARPRGVNEKPNPLSDPLSPESVTLGKVQQGLRDLLGLFGQAEQAQKV